MTWKRLLLSAFVFLVQLQATAQHIIKLEHTYFTSYFSVTEHIPVMVHYVLTSDMVTCPEEQKVPRSKGHFTADPIAHDETNLLKDYVRSGYDKGHNMSAADNGCNEQAMKECFYFSNMTPQPHFFNAGVWEKLERQERDEAADHGKIIVTTGSTGKAATIGPDEVVVPKYMWKVIYIPSKKRYECYIFPNSDEANKSLDDYETTLETLEAHADVTFSEGVAAMHTE